MRLAWLTDLHLNFVEEDVFVGFIDAIRQAVPDVILVSGDIGEADTVVEYLCRLSEGIGKPIYFVLGNHDFYRGSIATVRETVKNVRGAKAPIVWLSGVDYVSLTTNVALVGHDGWGDGGYGDASGSSVILNDYFLIDEFRERPHGDYLQKLKTLGDEAGQHFRTALPRALADHKNVIALTHVPPFRESCWHQGQIANDEWLPFFSCRGTGAAMWDVMMQHPDRFLHVFCGHTHSAGECQILPNLGVSTGGSTYGHPQLQRVVEVQ